MTEAIYISRNFLMSVMGCSLLKQVSSPLECWCVCSRTVFFFTYRTL